MKKRTVPTKQPVKTSVTRSMGNKQPTKPVKPTAELSDKQSNQNVDFDTPEESIGHDLSTKPFEELSLADAPSTHQSESSAASDQEQGTLNVKLSGDTNTPSITGCCFMPNGDLVICDNANQSVRSYNMATMINTGTLSLPVSPFDVASVDGNNVIVTLPSQKKLHLIQVLPSFQKGSTIACSKDGDIKECWGIDVAGDKIYVACYRAGREDGEVRIFGLFGNLIHGFMVYKIGPRVLKSLEYICVNKSRDKLYVTDSQTDTVLCLTIDGKKLVYSYSNAELKSPRGLCVNEKDSVLVCGGSSRNIQSIAADGKKDKTVTLTKPYSPSCVAFRTSDRKLVVGCNKKEDMLYYKLP